MASLAPPSDPPLSTACEDQGSNPFRMRVLQVSATMVTLLVTGWLCTLGAIAAIVALTVAKHVLVAILVMGLGVDAPVVRIPEKETEEE